MNEYACWLMGLTGTDGAWRGDLRMLLQALGRRAPGVDPAMLCEDLYGMSDAELLYLVHEALPDESRCGPLLGYLHAGRRQDPGRILARVEGLGMQCALCSDPAFPEALRHIPDPPLGLYWLGRLPDPERPALAVIGARMSSAYGRVQARDFAMECARNGIQIVSGMARGIDGIAGKAALEVSDDSFAVLGSGVDVCYPAENRELYQMLIERGGVISEYPPGIPAAKLNFPQRNRIISGLAQAVLVIEAREKSGTLITVDIACEQGRDVFALPGRVSDRTSHGCNMLIRQGAFPATCPDDLLTYYYCDTPRHVRIERQTLEEALPDEVARRREQRKQDREEQRAVRERKQRERLSRIGDVGQAIYAILDEATPTPIDDLVGPVRQRLQRRVSFSELMRAMTALMMAGLARELRVGNYVRIS